MKLFRHLCLAVLIIGGCIAPAGAQAKRPASQAASPAPSSSAAFEAQMLAYGGLNHITRALAAKVCSQPGVDNDTSTILIYDQTAFSSLQAYQAFVANIQLVSGAYRSLIVTAKHRSAAERQFSVTFSPFSDLAALLTALAIASNTENAGQITIPYSAVAISLTREIESACKSKDLTIIYPPFFGRGSSSDFASANIQAAIQTLDGLRADAQDAVDDANSAFISNSLQKTETTQTKKGTASAKGEETQHAIGTQTGAAAPSGDPVLTAALAEVDGLYVNFLNSLLQLNSSTGAIGSSSVIQGYQLATLLKGVKKDDGTWKQSPAFVVLASVLGAGGTEHVHKTFWTALTSGDKITYSGGAIVNVSLWQADSSSPLYADILRYRAPFADVKDPGNVEGVDRGDNLDEPPRARN